MPLRDGTGPIGFGPGSGRGRGGCRTGSGYWSIANTVFRGRKSWLLGIAVPLATALLRDVLNPSGILHRIAQASSAKKFTANANKNIREADYTVLNGDSVPILHGKKES